MSMVRAGFVVEGRADMDPLKKGLDDAKAKTTSLTDAAGKLATALVTTTAVAFVAAAREATAYEDTLTRLAFAVNSAGQSWEANSGRLQAFIADTARASMFAQRTVGEAMVVIANATAALEPTAAEMERMVRLSVDLADQTGMQLSQAAQTVATAFAGNTRAVSAAVPGLREYMRELQGVESVAMRGEMALQALEGQFAGASQGVQNTHHDVGMLAARMQDLLLVFGSQIVQSEAMQTALATATRYLQEMIEGVETGEGAMGDLAEAVGALADGIGIGLQAAMVGARAAMNLYTIAVNGVEMTLLTTIGAAETAIRVVGALGRAAWATANRDWVALRDATSEARGAIESFDTRTMQGFQTLGGAIADTAREAWNFAAGLNEAEVIAARSIVPTFWDDVTGALARANRELQQMRSREPDQRRTPARAAAPEQVVTFGDKDASAFKAQLDAQAAFLLEYAAKEAEIEAEAKARRESDAAAEIERDRALAAERIALLDHTAKTQIQIEQDRLAMQQSLYQQQVESLASAMAAAVGTTVATGENLGQGLARAALRSIGSMASALGRVLFLGGIGAQALPFLGFSGAGAIGAGLALQALGAGLGAVNIGGGGGRGAGSVASGGTGIGSTATRQQAPQTTALTDFRGAVIVTRDVDSMRQLTGAQRQAGGPAGVL